MQEEVKILFYVICFIRAKGLINFCTPKSSTFTLSVFFLFFFLDIDPSN